MRVLFATDGSAASETAMRTASRLLRSEGRDFDLMCIASPYSSQEESTPQDEYEEQVHTDVAGILGRAEEILMPCASALSVLAEIGTAGSLIADRAEDYDLTVIGANGTDERGESGLGAVANQVVESARGPLLIGRRLQNASQDGDAPRILVAVDGSSASRRAVETLENLFDLEAAEVSLMGVVETNWLDPDPESDLASASEEELESSDAGRLEREFVREAQEAIEDARALLRREQLLVNTIVAEGNPVNELLAEAERTPYDLIVVGATGSRDVKHSRLGSISQRLAGYAPCSVLIVSEPGETG